MAGGASDRFCVPLHREGLLSLLLLHSCKLLLIALTNGLRCSSLTLKLRESFEVHHTPLRINKLTILIANNLTLSLNHLLLLGSNLVSSHVVHLYNLLLLHLVVQTLLLQALILLSDQALGSFADHTLLLSVLLEVLMVGHTFGSDCTQHIVTLSDLCHPFHLLLLLLQSHGLI